MTATEEDTTLNEIHPLQTFAYLLFYLLCCFALMLLFDDWVFELIFNGQNELQTVKIFTFIQT
jgi:hypothetical protein